MQITCPSCGAAYAVPDEKLAGRAVKCARCGHQWTPVPALVAEPDVTPEIPQAATELPWPAPAPRIAEPATPPMADATPAPRSKGLLVAWVASFALIGAILASAYTHREGVMRAWPPSQRVYAALGLL